MNYGPETSTPDEYLEALQGVEAAAQHLGWPPFELAGLQAEKWSAVHHAIPEDATPELLAAAHQAAVCCGAEAVLFLDDPTRDIFAAEPEALQAIADYWQQADQRIEEIEDWSRARGLEVPRSDVARCQEQPCDDPERGTKTMDEDDKLTSQAIEADPWNAGPRSAASLQDDLVLEPIPTAVREPEVLAVRVSELAKLVEAEPGFSGDIAASRQDTLTPAMQSVSGPEEAAALGRMNDAETQDYAAHLGTLAAISLDASGQHDDADALRLEAQARTEIANNFRNPTPTNDGPGSGIEQPSSEPDGQADFRQDAEAAARANGFGPTATLVFMENTDKAPDMIGTNPEIVFEEARASVAPGGNDYSALHAQPMPEQAEPAAQFLDLSNEQQPEATMTRGITLGMGPGGATIMEVNHSPNVQEADAALEATNYAAPFRPGTQGMEEVAEAPQAATAEQYTQTGREAVAELPAAETPTQGRGWLTDFLAETKDEIEGDRGGAENEASHEPTEAFRSFGR